ncbi:hypothetical protein CYLTODRAFT_417196 [Cylindrobasidium torrendii FP15055 ss-10]|uniref:Protein kinase domain-containing protein n=1 Tax=Cylindrobasidium torrendii FP15055 ss-10 TaxID=1314674 RepID=A0A0D7BSL3_9AGAR|nr:hypothetical protein CYLTODRAFT_417196 [Cylindrobasidium torrendii FP15055 ss-10]
MAYRRTSPQTSYSSTATLPTPRPKHKLPRRSPPIHPPRHKRTASVEASEPAFSEDRPALVPLQPNLRRLPTRLLQLNTADEIMRAPNDSDSCPRAGSKRKRVASANENVASTSARNPARGASRIKRLRSESGRRVNGDGDSDSGSDTMKIDHGAASDEPSELTEEENEGEDSDENTDSHLLAWAPQHRLLRLRKDNLIRLYNLGDLPDDPEHLTKTDIVTAIIEARDEHISVPPSSPPGGSSDYSSDDDTQVDVEHVSPVHGNSFLNSLRRRATTDFPRNNRPPKTTNRSLSMGNVHSGRNRVSCDSSSSRRSSTRSSRSTMSRSPVASTSAAALLPSPPATRTRSRKFSNETADESISTPVANHSRRSVKSKSKQVEFEEPPVTPSRQKPLYTPSPDSESDLTDVETVWKELSAHKPSPRRLRSKDKLRDQATEQELEARRVTPMRKSKGRIKTFKEPDTDDSMEDEEVDELISASPTPRTPMRRRLRPRAHNDNEETEVEEELEEHDEEDLSTVTLVEDLPRRRRDVKVVSREIAQDEDQDAEMVEAEPAGDEIEVDGDDESGSVDLEQESIGDDEEDQEQEEEEVEEECEADNDDDVDLIHATVKTLARLRRDRLVRMCEARELSTTGTKPQLAQALIHWRNRQPSESRAATPTPRPPSTVKRARRRLRSSQDTATPPVLLRSDHVVPDDPNTPTPPAGQSQEAELELDLVSLGLHDREIPPDKLTKLEKIGSGGFKDVFIGKFKNKKVAIAEFRGQLSAMDIKELKLLGEFRHPNIVRFLGVSIPENTKDVPVMMISELCSNGDLFDYVRNVPAPSLSKVLRIMYEIAAGLEYLHLLKPAVIHRDCKSSNILITSRGNAKIADFGLAKVKQSTRSMMRSLVGTVNWQAPELWHAHPKYNHKVDTFACAMVFWEMLQWHQPVKKFPWEGMNEHAIYDIVGTKRQRPSIVGLKKQWECPEIILLMERMWAHEHEQRPDMSEVKAELEALVKQYSGRR